MASTMQPLPLPDFPPIPSSGPEPNEVNPSASSTGPSPLSPVEFYSTTTAPLRDDEQEPIASPTAAPNEGDKRRLRKVSNNSIASSSVLERPRPRPPTRESDSRPSSFYGIDANTDYDSTRPSREWERESNTPWQGTALAAQRPGAAEEGDNVEELQQYAKGRENQPSRSSFYGLEATTPIQPSPPPTGVSTPVTTNRNEPSPARHTLSSESSSSAALNGARPQTQHSSGSGSGSYSSHELPNRPRYSQAPYAASRAASLYGGNNSGSFGPPAAPLLDQSHLQPGNMASLLSHDKTLELYRQNAKKTNDVNVQFEFCAFVMEVVAELEQATAMEKMAQQVNVAGGGGGGGGTEQIGGEQLTEVQKESKRKQKALVTESITLLNKLAQRGHVKSQYFLADCYTQGVGTLKGKRDYDKAFPLFMLAGKHGHVDASFRAAQCLEHGWGCRKDQSKAVSFYRRAAVLSHPGSMHRLGLAEINGELGLTKRPKDGVQWLKRAAELADQVDPPQPQSLHELAILHEKGIENVIFQDEEYAAELLARASELQYAPSAYKLGECYEYGKMACPQDAALSIHYYNIAAQQNHPAACFALTAWYLVGSPGILPQSDTEAYLWAKKSAEMGFPKAEYACGYFTESGIGTYPDAREALEWFRKAASHGDKRALDRLRSAGQPLPAQVPVLRNTPSSNALSSNNFPALPDKNRSSKMLTKNKQQQPLPPQPPIPRHQQPRSESAGRVPRPVSKDVKGKGRAEDPSMTRPGFTRQRSNSQPVPYDARYQYGQQQQPAQQQNDFSPMSYGNGVQAATVGGKPRYAQEQNQRTYSPVRPDQARMPLRQQQNNVPEVGRDVEAKKPAREHVLQRRAKGGNEKKGDCTIM
ncbi:hypothetical protein JCM16303_005410 [Sporobolomyces ruberrimus]